MIRNSENKVILFLVSLQRSLLFVGMYAHTYMYGSTKKIKIKENIKIYFNSPTRPKYLIIGPVEQCSGRFTLLFYLLDWPVSAHETCECTALLDRP